MLKTLLRKVNAESGGARVQWRALRRSAHEGQSVCATLATFGSREGYLEWLQPFLLLNSCRSLPSAVGINSSGWILPFMVCETCGGRPLTSLQSSNDRSGASLIS